MTTDAAMQVDETSVLQLNQSILAEIDQPVVEAVCFGCKHLIYWPYCRAFPDGIPGEIRLGMNDHKLRVEGDGGYRWQALVITNAADEKVVDGDEPTTVS